MKLSRARHAVTGLLLLLLLALTGVALYPPSNAYRPPPPLTSLDPAAIDRLRIEGPDGNTIALALQAGRWQLTKPARLPVDELQLQDLLRIAAAPSISSYPLARFDDAEIGLANPQAQVLINDTLLQFGDRTATGGLRYARIDDTVHLIPNSHFHTVSLPLSDYVTTALFVDDTDIEALTLPELRLWRGPEGGWRSEPGALDARQAAMLVTRWRQAKAAAVQPWQPGLTELGRVVATVQNTDTGIEFIIEKLPDAPDFILARPDQGLRYHFSPAAGQRLLGRDLIPDDA